MPMTPRRRTLRSKIAAFEIDDPASKLLAVSTFAAVGVLAVSAFVAVGGEKPNATVLSNPVTSFVAEQFLIFYPVAWVVLMALTTRLQRGLLYKPVPQEIVREFEHESPETIALLHERLADGCRLAELLASRLFAQGRIRYDAGKKRLVHTEHGPKPTKPFDAEMLAVIESRENAARVPGLADYAAAIRMRPVVREAIDRLLQRHLLLEADPLHFAQRISLAAILTWLAIGLARVMVVQAGARPDDFRVVEDWIIGCLMVEMIVGGVVGLLWLPGPILQRWYSPATQILWKLDRATQFRIPALRQRFADEPIPVADDDYWRCVAIAGLNVLPWKEPYDEFVTYLRPPSVDG